MSCSVFKYTNIIYIFIFVVNQCCIYRIIKFQIKQRLVKFCINSGFPVDAGLATTLISALGQCLLTHPIGQKGCHFGDDFTKCISWMTSYVFWFEFHCNLFIRIQINNKLALDQVMAQHQTGNKLLPNQCWPGSRTLMDVRSTGGDVLKAQLNHPAFKRCTNWAVLMIYLIIYLIAI